jgi:hypothetical protein
MLSQMEEMKFQLHHEIKPNKVLYLAMVNIYLINTKIQYILFK